MAFEGGRVELHSLSRAELNGLRGQCGKRNPESGRWEVTVDDARVLSVREENLRTVQAAEAAATAEPEPEPEPEPEAAPMDVEPDPNAIPVEEGATVELHSLSKDALNGRRGVCGGRNDESGRWEVTLDGGKVLALKEANLLAVVRAPAKVEAAAEAEAPTAVDPDAIPVEEGATVELHSLSKDELNGRRGVCGGKNAAGRWEVTMDGGKVLALKEANLLAVVRAPASAAAAAAAAPPPPPPAAAAAAAPPAPTAAIPSAEEAKRLGSFLEEVKKVEEKDSQWTAEKQIHRLTKAGTKYLNLNPYEVLQVEQGTAPADIKKQYRKLSFLVHPDKNRDNVEMAQKAFEELGLAYAKFEDKEKMLFVNQLIDEATAEFEKSLEAKRFKARRAGNPRIEEDDPEAYASALRKATVLKFADVERRKKELEENHQNTKKREHVEGEEEAARKKSKKEKEQAWEKTREVRVSSWNDFKQGKSKKKKKERKLHKPPKLRTEGQ